MLKSLFNKVSRLQACKFIKKRLRDRCLFTCESSELFKNTYFGENLRTAAFGFCILNTTLRQTTLQRPSPNIAKQQEEEIESESESFKSKLTLH